VTQGFDQSTDIVYVGFLTGHGGDAVQMQLLADGMRRRGARVKVVVPAVATSIGFAERCDELGLECERSELIRADMHGPHQNIARMLRLFQSLHAPIVHVHTGNSCVPRAAMAALEIHPRRRIFVTIQSPYQTIEPGSRRARTWAWSARRRCHAVVSPSEHGTDSQRSFGVPDARLATIRNAIDVTAMNSGDGGSPRRELGLRDDDPMVVFTSRIDPQKRPVDAVRMFARCVDAHPRAVLVFVGTGSESAAVATRAAELGLSDRVHLVGHRSDVADWLAAATVWILPTERENFSVAVLEAMAAGCAVVSTNCPGNDEVLSDGVNSLTFDVGDVERGAAALQSLLDDPVLRDRLGHAARLRSQDYSVGNMVSAYADLYERFVPLGSRSHFRAVTAD
jgi:glycosyltransferase involved in cell wall biosynthesis